MRLSSRKMPSMALVIVELCVFSTPRMTMHKCLEGAHQIEKPVALGTRRRMASAGVCVCVCVCVWVGGEGQTNEGTLPLPP